MSLVKKQDVKLAPYLGFSFSWTLRKYAFWWINSWLHSWVNALLSGYGCALLSGYGCALLSDFHVLFHGTLIDGRSIFNNFTGVPHPFLPEQALLFIFDYFVITDNMLRS